MLAKSSMAIRPTTTLACHTMHCATCIVTNQQHQFAPLLRTERHLRNMYH